MKRICMYDEMGELVRLRDLSDETESEVSAMVSLYETMNPEAQNVFVLNYELEYEDYCKECNEHNEEPTDFEEWLKWCECAL